MKFLTLEIGLSPIQQKSIDKVRWLKTIMLLSIVMLNAVLAFGQTAGSAGDDPYEYERMKKGSHRERMTDENTKSTYDSTLQTQEKMNKDLESIFKGLPYGAPPKAMPYGAKPYESDRQSSGKKDSNFDR